MRFLRTGGTAPAPGAARAAPRAARRGTALWVIAIVGLLMLALAGLVGAVVGLGSLPLVLLMVGPLFIAPLVFVVSTRLMLPLMFVFIFAVQGTASNYLNLRITTWMASGIAFLFLVRAFFELSGDRSVQKAARARSGAAAGVMACAALYLACFAFSMSIGSATPAQALSAIRFGIPMFGVLFALYWFEWQPGQIERLFIIIMALTALQLPLVAYQHFFEIDTGAGWDAVVGTFGHGMSPVLVLFSLTAACYALARWSRGIMRGTLAAAVCCTALAVILLGEVKAVAIWVPLALSIILRKKITRNLGSFIMYGAFVTIFVVGVFAAYKALYWGEAVKSTATLEESVDQSGGYFFDTQAINYRTGEISRAASLDLWYRDPVPSVLERLVGYGPGASSTGMNTGKGIVAERYGILSINATAVAQLLWDVGIVGALAYLSIFGFAIFTAQRYVARGGAAPADEAVVDTCLALTVLAATTVIYNRTLLDEPTVQLLSFFGVGCIVQYARYHHPNARRAAQRCAPAPVLHPLPEVPARSGNYHRAVV